MKYSRLINTVALLIMLLANGLASATDLVGGQRTGAVSDAYPTLFTPAGYVFAIWSVIYIGLIALVIYQLRPGAEAVRARLGPWLAVNAILNAAWLFLWGAELLWLSLVAMLGILATLIALYERLGIGRTQASTAERWAVRTTISVYTGWISVATIANVAIALVGAGWDGTLGQGGIVGPQFWVIVTLIAGTALGLLAVLWRRDVAYALVVVWAFVGIAVARAQEPGQTLLVVAALLGAVIVGAASAYSGIVRRGARLSG